MPKQPLKPNQKKDQAKKPVSSTSNDTTISAVYLIDKGAKKPTEVPSSSLKGSRS